ncbi:reverse transcriptase domain-containing protein [Trichonephila clavipes]|nr:reverse transcriptase domain-containing protein [Trichonephila clavipes]
MQGNYFEAVGLNLWKGNTKTKLIFAYNPPGNPSLTHILESSLDKNTSIIRDFNSTSPRWSYVDINPHDRVMDDFLNSSPETLVQGSFLGRDIQRKKKNAKKEEKRLSLLTRLAGVTWRSSPDVLSTPYKFYVRSVLDYGGEFLATTSKICGDIIDRIQNIALRLNIYAVPSSPIVALEILTNIEPLGVRRKKPTTQTN